MRTREMDMEDKAQRKGEIICKIHEMVKNIRLRDLDLAEP